MGHAFHQLYYHFAWATHCRQPLIHRSDRPKILLIVNEEAKKRGGLPIRHNAMPDHVHLLIRLPPTIAPSDFIGEVKTKSRRSRDTSTDRRNITRRGDCRSSWRRLAAKATTKSPAPKGASMGKGKENDSSPRVPGVNAWARGKRRDTAVDSGSSDALWPRRLCVFPANPPFPWPRRELLARRLPFSRSLGVHALFPGVFLFFSSPGVHAWDNGAQTSSLFPPSPSGDAACATFVKAHAGGAATARDNDG